MATNGKKSSGTTFNASIPPRIDGEDWLNFGRVWIGNHGRGALFLELNQQQLQDALKHLNKEGKYEVTVPLFPKKAKAANTTAAAAPANAA